MTPQCHGGFADVWKGRHNGQEVAAKVLRVSLKNNFERIGRASFHQHLVFINELTGPHVEILQGGRDLEIPLPSERFATVGRDNDR